MSPVVIRNTQPQTSSNKVDITLDSQAMMRVTQLTKQSHGEVTTLAGASNAFDLPQSRLDLGPLRHTNRELQLKQVRGLNRDIEAVDSRLAKIQTGTGQIEVAGSPLRGGAVPARKPRNRQLQFSLDVDPLRRKTNIAGEDGAWKDVQSQFMMFNSLGNFKHDARAMRLK